MEGLSTGGREGGSIGEDPGGVGRGREHRGEKERGGEESPWPLLGRYFSTVL